MRGDPPRLLGTGSAIGGHPESLQFGRDASVVYASVTRPTTGLLEIIAIRMADGVPRVLVREDSTHRFGGTGFATDGKRLYFTFADWTSSIKVMELTW